MSEAEHSQNLERPRNLLKRTALYPLHVSLGANLVDFGGWEMPLWYPEGAVREHLAVVRSAGMFDTSHMSVVLLDAPNVRSFLNYAITKELSTLKSGRVTYGLILDENGCVLDDTIVYPLDETRFAVVLNAGKNHAIIEHLRTLPDGEAVRFTDLTGRLAKIDLQGPLSYRLLRPLIRDPDAVFDDLRYFGFRGEFDLSESTVFLNDGTPILLSRSGYTGELGFEIFLATEHAATLWNAIREQGAKHSPAALSCCGLAARDSLRTGALLPLSGQDIGNWPFLNTPWSFALPYDGEGKFTKAFHGAETLRTIADSQTDAKKGIVRTLPFLGFDPRKVDPHEASVFHDGKEIGTVLTAVADMAVGRVDGRVFSVSSPNAPQHWTPRGLVCGFLKVNRDLAPGTIVTLKDKRRSLDVEIVAEIRPNRTARNTLE